MGCGAHIHHTGACGLSDGRVVGVGGKGSSGMVGYRGAGVCGWRPGEGKSKVVSGYAVADGKCICEHEGAQDRRKVVAVE